MSDDDNCCGFDEDEWNSDSNTRVRRSHQLQEHYKKHSDPLTCYRYLYGDKFALKHLGDKRLDHKLLPKPYGHPVVYLEKEYCGTIINRCFYYKVELDHIHPRSVICNRVDEEAWLIPTCDGCVLQGTVDCTCYFCKLHSRNFCTCEQVIASKTKIAMKAKNYTVKK